MREKAFPFPSLCQLGTYGLGVGVAVLSADVFYQVKVLSFIIFAFSWSFAHLLLPHMHHLPLLGATLGLSGPLTAS